MAEVSDNFVWGVIYKWTNKLNGKSYIGQTTREEARKYEHLHDTRFNPYFHNAVQKYGEDNFNYDVLLRVHCPKEFAKEILDYNEKKFIREYRTLDNGYNLTDGGDCSRNISVHKAVLQFDKKGNFIAEYASITDAANALDGGESLRKHISAVCKGTDQRKTAGGYKWKYKELN